MEKKKKRTNKFLLITGAALIISFTGISAEAEVVTVNEDSYLAEVLSGIDYSNVIAENNGYVVLEKNISGFDVNEIQYGIYDLQHEEWSMEYTVLPESDVPRTDLSGSPDTGDYFIDFTYNGEGMFSYDYYDSWKGETYICFLSASAGGYFLIDSETSKDEIWFENGKALFVLDDYKNGYVDGCIPPDNKLCWISVFGEINDFEISGYENTTPETFAYFNYNNYGYWNCDAYIFSNINHDECMIIYCRDQNQTVYIHNPDYMSRLSAESKVLVFEWGASGFFVYIADLRGDDGKYYFVLFDQNGEPLTSPVYTPDELRSETPYWDFTGKNDYDSELLGSWIVYSWTEKVTFLDDGSYIAEDFGDTGGTEFISNYLVDKENQVLYISPGGDGSRPGKYVLFDDYLYYNGNIWERSAR